MNLRLCLTLASLATFAVPVSAQVLQRRATMTGGGNYDRGKCTIEVVVDGAAEIEFRGDMAYMRNLSGNMPQWRRFDCNSVMPRNPVDFKFSGVDGRGRQQLVRDPRGGGAAVVRIEDPSGGSEGYTFDIEWSGGSGVTNNGRYSDNGRYNDGRNGGWQDRGTGGSYSNDAVASCQNAIRQQAGDRIGTSDIVFQRMNVDDNPGRRDLIAGTFDARGQRYRYSCSVNLNNGRVQNAQIENTSADRVRPRYGYDNPGNVSGGTYANDPVQACQQAAQQRLNRDGYNRVDFRSNPDTRRGRVTGTALANNSTFEYSCSVDARGNVGNLDLRRR